MSSVLFLIEASFLLQSLLRDNFCLCSDLTATSPHDEAAFDFVFCLRNHIRIFTD